VEASWTKPKQRAGITKPIIFHNLRETFAAIMICELRLDVKTISLSLGHSSTQLTLDTYAHLFDSLRKHAEVRDAMDGFMTEPRPTFGSTSNGAEPSQAGNVVAGNFGDPR
jgi:site-specific recombinase XerD